MRTRTGLPLLLIVATFACALHPFASAQDRPDAGTKQRTVAIVRDGKSWYFNRSEKLFLEELKSLASDNYSLDIREYDGRFDADEIGKLLGQALADPETDMVYASGVIASERAASLPDNIRIKPVLAGSVLFSDVRAHPLTDDGTSATPNYTLISEPNRATADLRLLQRITNSAVIHLIVDEKIFPELLGIENARAAVQETLGVTIEVVAIPSDAPGALAAIPSSARAVYVPIQPRMDPNARKVFYEGLAKRGAITVPMLGREDVVLGAVAGLATDQTLAVAKMAALSAHQILLGTPTERIPVVLPIHDSFVINAHTAELAAWSPTYDIFLEAEFIGEFHAGRKVDITINKAMRCAAGQNTSVLIAREEEAVQAQETRSLISNTLPQVDGTVGASLSKSEIDIEGNGRIPNNLISPDLGLFGGSTNSTGNEFTHARAFGVEVQQLLFSDELYASIRAQRKNEKSTRLDTRSEELDAMDSASGAYIDALEAEVLYQIERQNLSLTKNNLQLAQLRIDIGTAEPTEIYRWEQSLARDRATLIQRDSFRRMAMIELNRILSTPRETEWNFTPLEVNEEDVYFLDDYLRPLLANRDSALRFRTFVRWYAIENSPELASFDYALGAQGELLRQKQRSFFLPDIAGVVSADRTGLDTNATPLGIDGINEFSAGVQLSLPFFEGGNRKAEVAKQMAEIRQLAASRLRAVEQLETQALFAFEEMASAHPSIKLSRISLEASKKNYDAVSEKYSQGSSSILDLLDAQDQLLSQQQQEASAIFDYLSAVFGLQRSLAWFEWEKSDLERQQMGELIQCFLRGAVPVEHYINSMEEEDAAETVNRSGGIPPYSNPDGGPPRMVARPVETQEEKPEKKKFFLFRKHK